MILWKYFTNTTGMRATSNLRLKFLPYCYWLVVGLLLTLGFEERFQKEAGLCSSAVRPALIKVIYFMGLLHLASSKYRLFVLFHPFKQVECEKHLILKNTVNPYLILKIRNKVLTWGRVGIKFKSVPKKKSNKWWAEIVNFLHMVSSSWHHTYLFIRWVISLSEKCRFLVKFDEISCCMSNLRSI